MKKWKFVFWVMCFLTVLSILQLPFFKELNIGAFIGSFVSAISLVSFTALVIELPSVAKC